jgi:hypothetical protein
VGKGTRFSFVIPERLIAKKRLTALSTYLPMTSFGWSFSFASLFSRVINERSLLFCSHD